MAVTVDELIIEIQANTAGVRKDLDKVNKKLGQTNKTVKQITIIITNNNDMK